MIGRFGNPNAFRGQQGHDASLNRVQRDLEDTFRARDSAESLGDEVVTFSVNTTARPQDRCFVFRGQAAATLTMCPAATSYGRQRSALLRATNRSTVVLTIRFSPTVSTTLAAGASLMFWSDGQQFASVT